MSFEAYPYYPVSFTNYFFGKNPSVEEVLTEADDSDERSLAVFENYGSVIVGESTSSLFDSNSDNRYSEYKVHRTPSFSLDSFEAVHLDKEESDSWGEVPFLPNSASEDLAEESFDDYASESSMTYAHHVVTYPSHMKDKVSEGWQFDDSKAEDLPMNALHEDFEDNSVAHSPASREEYYSGSSFSQLLALDLFQGPPPMNTIASQNDIASKSNESFPELFSHFSRSHGCEKNQRQISNASADSTLSMLSIGYDDMNLSSEIERLMSEQCILASNNSAYFHKINRSRDDKSISRSREFYERSSISGFQSIAYHQHSSSLGAVSLSSDAEWLSGKPTPSQVSSLYFSHSRSPNNALAIKQNNHGEVEECLYIYPDQHAWLDLEQFEEFFQFPLQALHNHMGIFWNTALEKNYE